MIHFELFDTGVYYDMLRQWWVESNWPPVDKDHLPHKGCGVFRNNGLVAAGFLYLNGSALSNFEWIIADPKVRREERTEVLNALFEGAKAFARVAGVKSIFMSTRHELLISRLEKAGFQKTDLNMTNLVARV